MFRTEDPRKRIHIKSAGFESETIASKAMLGLKAVIQERLLRDFPLA
jgi:hypothetical protein